MSEDDSEELSDLETRIRALIVQFPDKKDSEIAGLVSSSRGWVNRVRKRMKQTETERGAEAATLKVTEEGATATEEKKPDIETVTEDNTLKPPTLAEKTEEKKPTEIQPTEEKQTYLFQEKDISKLVTITFRKIARWTDFEGWELTSEEKEDLVPLATQMMNKYLPAIMAKYMMEAMFCYTLVMVVGSKFGDYRKAKQKEKEETPITLPTEEKKPEEKKPEEKKPEEKKPQTTLAEELVNKL